MTAVYVDVFNTGPASGFVHVPRRLFLLKRLDAKDSGHFKHSGLQWDFLWSFVEIGVASSRGKDRV